MSEDNNDKPIIRHCINCKYRTPGFTCDGECTVKYQTIEYGRLKAIFCKYYKAKTEVANE